MYAEDVSEPLRPRGVEPCENIVDEEAADAGICLYRAEHARRAAVFYFAGDVLVLPDVYGL